MAVLAIVLTVAVFGFIVYIGREEYGVAGRERHGRTRAVLRAIRVRFDSLSSMTGDDVRKVLFQPSHVSPPRAVVVPARPSKPSPPTPTPTTSSPPPGSTQDMGVTALKWIGHTAVRSASQVIHSISRTSLSCFVCRMRKDRRAIRAVRPIARSLARWYQFERGDVVGRRTRRATSRRVRELAVADRVVPRVPAPAAPCGGPFPGHRGRTSPSLPVLRCPLCRP